MIKVVLLLVAVTLTGVLTMQWRDWPRALSPVASPGADPGAAAGSEQPAAGLPTAPAPPEAKETYAGVAERPLFRPQRRPEPPVTSEPDPETVVEDIGTLDGLDLTAVLISPGVTSAWIKDPSLPELKRLRLGDEQAGWSVKSILADRLVFERQGETHELLLLDFPAPGEPSVPNATPMPQPAARPAPPPRPVPPMRPTAPVPAPPGGLQPGALPPGTLGRQPPRAPVSGGNQRGAPPPPSPLQPRPNVRRPLPSAPQ